MRYPVEMQAGSAPEEVSALLESVSTQEPDDDLAFIAWAIEEILTRNPGVVPISDQDPCAAANVDELLDHSVVQRLDRLTNPVNWRDRQLHASRTSPWAEHPHPPKPPAPERVQFQRMDMLGERAMPMADFWTSTVIAKDISSTSLWMENQGYNRNAFTGPEHRWRLPVTPDARVYDLDGARAWLQLEATFGIPGKQFDRIIDWNQFADAYDALRVTWRGVVATQGIVYHTARGQLAPSWWDIESFMPTRWCFLDATRLPNRP